MRNTLTLLSITSLVVLMAANLQSSLELNNDLSWLSHATERMLAGGTYANNFFETNPPLILYLLLPAIITIKHFSLSFVGTLKSYIFLLSILSLAINAYLLNKIFSPKDERIKQLFFAAMAISFLLLPMEHFGQREHIAVLLVTPYILLASLRKQNSSAVSDSKAVLIGIIASLGFCLKPFFVLPLIAVELYVKRWYARPEIFPIIITPILYTIVVALFFPDYFSVIIPYTTRLYYLGSSNPFTAVMSGPCLLFSLLTLPLFFVNIRYNHLLRLLLITTFSFCLAHVVQRMTLYYHILPAFCFAMLCYALTIFCVFKERQPKALHYLIFALLGLCIFLYMSHFYSYVWTLVVFDNNVFYGYLALIFFITLQLTPFHLTLLRSLFLTLFVMLNVVLISHFVQFTDYYDHQFIITLLLMLIGLSIVIKSTIKQRAHHLFYGVALTVLFSFPAHHCYLHYRNALGWNDLFKPMMQFVKTNPQYRSFYTFMETSSFTFMLMDHTQLQYASRFPFMWMVSGLLKQQLQDVRLYQKDKDFLLQMVNADLQLYKPDLLLVDQRATKFNWHTHNYDYLADFSKDETFKNILKHYHYLRTYDFKSPDNQLHYTFGVYERIR